jgi:hypothetical protein
VAIHGESKHGKSWLRARTLPESKIARVQCTPNMTSDDVLTQCLGRLRAYETVKWVVTESGELTTKLDLQLARGRSKASIGGGYKRARGSSEDRQLVGQDRRDLGWVAEQFRIERRVPVFEDFHNLADSDQKVMADVIKALGEWQVPCVVVGIWTDAPRLKLYNGELDGRIVDLQVKWETRELRDVLARGCKALNVVLSDAISERMVRDAYTSVGLLQELARATLDEAGVHRRRVRRLTVEDPKMLQAGRAVVVSGIAARFEPFLELFPKATIAGVSSTIPGLLARYVAGAPPQDLLRGVTVKSLAREFAVDDISITEADVVLALEGLDGAQRDANIKPAVLAYDPARQRLILSDRRLLLFLKERPVRP